MVSAVFWAGPLTAASTTTVQISEPASKRHRDQQPDGEPPEAAALARDRDLLDGIGTARRPSPQRPGHDEGGDHDHHGDREHEQPPGQRHHRVGLRAVARQV